MLLDYLLTSLHCTDLDTRSIYSIVVIDEWNNNYNQHFDGPLRANEPLLFFFFRSSSLSLPILIGDSVDTSLWKYERFERTFQDQRRARAHLYFRWDFVQFVVVFFVICWNPKCQAINANVIQSPTTHFSAKIKSREWRVAKANYPPYSDEWIVDDENIINLFMFSILIMFGDFERWNWLQTTIK